MSLMSFPRQLWLAFAGGEPKSKAAPEAGAMDKAVKPQAGEGRDAALEIQARKWLDGIGMNEEAKLISVEWNARMRSTAGYAKWPQWLVELNPRLKEFDGEIERTLKHELAHLIAYARAGRRRIQPHGAEWRQACADLGILNERVSHTMPLPRHKQRRKFSYVCPACGTGAERVRKFKRHTACLACCKKHNKGRYDVRFQFVMKPS